MPKCPKCDHKYITSTEESESFKEFWELYPKKMARKVAVAAWNKLDPNPDLVGTMLISLRLQRESEQWKKNDGEFVPLPATWINQGRWEDKVMPLPMPEPKKDGIDWHSAYTHARRKYGLDP